MVGPLGWAHARQAHGADLALYAVLVRATRTTCSAMSRPCHARTTCRLCHVLSAWRSAPRTIFFRRTGRDTDGRKRESGKERERRRASDKGRGQQRHKETRAVAQPSQATIRPAIWIAGCCAARGERAGGRRAASVGRRVGARRPPPSTHTRPARMRPPRAPRCGQILVRQNAEHQVRRRRRWVRGARAFRSPLSRAWTADA